MKDLAVPPAAVSIGRALDLVERDLGAQIGVQDMAKAACFSLFHFIRLFQHATGYSPYDYLMRRRLTRGFELLRDTERRIIDVAMDVGFQAPEAFARAFRKIFGVLPREARRMAAVPGSLLRPPLDTGYVAHRCRRPATAPGRTTTAGWYVLGVVAAIDDTFPKTAASLCRAVLARGKAAHGPGRPLAVIFPDHPGRSDGALCALVGGGFQRPPGILGYLETHLPSGRALSFPAAREPERLRYAIEDALILRQLRLPAACLRPQIIVDLGTDGETPESAGWEVLLPYHEQVEEAPRSRPDDPLEPHDEARPSAGRRVS